MLLIVGFERQEKIVFENAVFYNEFSKIALESGLDGCAVVNFWSVGVQGFQIK